MSSLEGEESCTHLNGTAEGHLAISLAEVHVSHTQVGSLNEHREVNLFQHQTQVYMQKMQM